MEDHDVSTTVDIVVETGGEYKITGVTWRGGERNNAKYTVLVEGAKAAVLQRLKSK
jgi:flavin-dependent dehydrogenase